MTCCCNWGAAVRGEWPEFECGDCPVHGGAFGVDHLCRGHRAEINLNGRSDDLVGDLVALERDLR